MTWDRSKYPDVTDAQWEAVVAYDELGCQTKAAEKLGISRASLRGRLRYAALKGLSPALAPVGVPSGTVMRRTCVHYNKDGEVVQEWRRPVGEAEDMAAFKESLLAAIREETTWKMPVCGDRRRSPHMLELMIPDLHWGVRSGTYSVDDAAGNLMDAMYRLTQPQDYGRMVISLLGDTLHSDFRSNRTEHSGNRLETTEDYPTLVKTLMATLKELVTFACRTTNRVELVIVPGNHDWHSSIWIAECLAAAFPGLSVRWGEHVIIEHGKCLLGHTHGDGGRGQLGRLPNLMFHLRPDASVASHPFRAWRLGHYHTNKKLGIEPGWHDGCQVEILDAVSPLSSHGRKCGYIPRQEARAFLWHESKGLVQTRSHIISHGL